MTKKRKKNWNFERFFSPINWNLWLLFKPFIVSSLWVIFPLITVEIFKKATIAIQNWEYEWIKSRIYIYVILCFLWFILGFSLKNTDIIISNKIEQLLQWERLKKYLRLDNTEVEKLWTWKIQSILSKWITTWKNLFLKLTSSIPSILITWAYALFQIYQALWLRYCLWFFILPFGVYFFVQYFNSKAIPRRKERSNILTDYSRQFIKILMSKMEIVQNKKEHEEILKGNLILNQATEAKKKVITYLFAIGESIRIFWYALNLFILWYWIHLINTWWDLAIFVWLIVCSTLFTTAVEKFSNFYKEFTNEFSEVQKLRDTFDWISNMKNIDSKKSFKYKKWEITINNLFFSYNENNIFNNFSLKIECWKKTAFVWESWSWKSTLIKLIAWYLSPDKWEILVDWQDISTISIYDYFSNIWFLTQDPSVFDGNIYDNLVYALKEKPKDTKIKKVIKDARCEFIYDFPEWVETEIWEKWVRLSWWQKQRLAIAKIMLKNPNIILLDEPTSALDSFNEEEISQALNNLFNWKTVIIVAHRLQTVKSADRILLFKNWKIIEDWTHQSLIRKNWKYKRMIDLQSGF